MTTTFTWLPGPGIQLMSATPGPDLAAAGYQEHEYVVHGAAARFLADDLPEDGRVTAQATEPAPFRTRVLIRRPARPGPVTLVVEWLNVSSGDDAAPDYTYLADEIVRQGHVWVGVSAQYVGVEGGRALVPTGDASSPENGLKHRDPARYGDLQHPGDAYCYGIFTAVAEALSDAALDQPLREFEVHRRIAVGESQSAFALTTYVNVVQPLTGCFDAFLVHSRGSAGLPLGEAGTGIDLDTVRHLPTFRIRDDLDTPVIVLETETDVVSPRLHYWQARQPDGPCLRVWEVAGTAHADRWQIGEFEEILGCPDPVNTGQQAYVVRAALRWLDTWAGGGPAAPAAPPLDLDASDPARFLIDRAGNVTGGVRTPAVEVPTRVLTGIPAPDASIICSLFGRTLPLAEDVLRDLYADRADYLARYADAVQAAIEAGFVLPEDAAAVLAEALPDLVPEA
jgi:hypothetical protein